MQQPLYNIGKIWMHFYFKVKDPAPIRFKADPELNKIPDQQKDQ